MLLNTFGKMVGDAEKKQCGLLLEGKESQYQLSPEESQEAARNRIMGLR